MLAYVEIVTLYLKKIIKILYEGDQRCGGSLLAHQTSEAEVPGSNPASPTMIFVNNVEKSLGREENLPVGQKKYTKKGLK